MAKNVRTVQTCSLCGKTGHNRRKCPMKDKVVLESKKTRKNVAKTAVPKIRKVSGRKVSKKKVVKIKKQTPISKVVEKKKKSNFIKVNVVGGAKPSPHVVNFNKVETNKHWDKIEVYKEKPSKKTKRVSVNLAELIKEANKTGVNIEELAKRVNNRPSNKQINGPVEIEEKSRFNFNSGLSLFVFGIKDKVNSFVRSFSFDFKIKRLVPAMMTLLVLVVLPFPAVGYYHAVREDTQKIVEKSTDAFLSLQSSTLAALGSNIPQAKYDLNQALNAFGEAESILDKEYGAAVFVAKLLPVVGTKISSRQNLLLAGHSLALGNSYLVKGVDESMKSDSDSLVKRLNILRAHIISALPQYDDAMASLSKVDMQTLPVEYQESFEEFKMLFTTFVDDMRDMADVSELIASVLGTKEFKRYLIVFQNNHELRATGGFVGSFAILDVQKGKIMDINIPAGGSYDLQGQLDVYLKPPLPMQVVNSRWEFQDSNWFPDFPASAQKMSWFYTHSRGATVDGVIAVNATILERLLKVMGPIYNEEYDLLIASQDVLEKIQHEVEYGDDKQDNKPKAVLSSVLDELVKNLETLEPKSLVHMVGELNESLNEKEIQVYFNDKNEQQRVKEFGWSGEVVETEDSQDYLYVVNTNLGGGKSDKSIEQTIEHQAVIQDDGSIIDTVVIRRTHTGDSDDDFYGDANSNYLRMYVPDGSELLDAGGFSMPEEDSFVVPPDWYENDTDLAKIENKINVDVESGTQIGSEFGKTVFSNWVFTEPGKTSEVYFVYKLPFSVFSTDKEDWFNKDLSIAELAGKVGLGEQKKDLSRYSLYVQKQSGFLSGFYNTTIYPDGWRPVWKARDSMQVTLNGSLYENELETDKLLGLVMKKNNN